MQQLSISDEPAATKKQCSSLTFAKKYPKLTGSLIATTLLMLVSTLIISKAEPHSNTQRVAAGLLLAALILAAIIGLLFACCTKACKSTAETQNLINDDDDDDADCACAPALCNRQ
jgi:hypothetical protein